MDVFFTVIMVNSCKGYSSSFSDVLLMCIASAASLQIMSDRGREASVLLQFLFAGKVKVTQTIKEL